MLTTTTDDICGRGRLRLARLGSGPPLVLLHGYPETLQVFSALAPLLAEDHEVLAFDWPGMGHSDPWPGGATPFHLADRLVVLLDTLKLPRATIVGMDMGGQPALAFAARHGDRVERLVVMNSLVIPDAHTSWEIAMLRHLGLNRLILRWLPRVVFHRAVHTFLLRRTSLPETVRADFWEGFRRPQVRAWIAKMCSGYQGTLGTLAQEYSSIQCPTLALWGERDHHFPPPHGRVLAERIPKATFRQIPSGQHWMVLEKPAEVSAAIREFIAGPR